MKNMDEQKMGSVGNNNMGGNNVPPPPDPNTNINLRTMNTDIGSVAQSGGGLPEPESISFSEIENNTPKAMPQAPEPAPAFHDDDLPYMVKDRAVSGSSSWVFWFLFFLLLLAGIFLGYFYVWPQYKDKILPPKTEEVGQPAVNTPAETAQPATPAQQQHVSAIGMKDNEIVKVDLTNYDKLPLLAMIKNQSKNVNDRMVEVALTVNGAPADFTSFVGSLMDDSGASKDLFDFLKQNFESDFTYYMQKENGVVWPGYVVKLKAEAQIDQVNLLAKLADLEKINLNDLFITTPQGKAQGFRSGAIGERFNSRYNPYSVKPASFNYGMLGNYLVISTTYKGIFDAAGLLSL